jgi:hypothetical protein
VPLDSALVVQRVPAPQRGKVAEPGSLWVTLYEYAALSAAASQRLKCRDGEAEVAGAAAGAQTPSASRLNKLSSCLAVGDDFALLALGTEAWAL